MSAIYGVDDPDKKLEMFNIMLFDCMERHVPLKGTKIHLRLKLTCRSLTSTIFCYDLKFS